MPIKYIGTYNECIAKEWIYRQSPVKTPDIKQQQLCQCVSLIYSG